jgi:glutathione reductase (NADPH)
MAKHYDLVVVGTGTAATVAASRCRAAGWTVAVIDHRPFGGTCALRGCDPKKVLVGVAEAADWPRRMQSRGIAAGDLRIDWPALMRFKRGFTDPVPSNKEANFAKQGIAAFHGHARFTGRNTLEVAGEAFEGRHILLAAGAEPIRLGIAGEEQLITSDQFLELDNLPKRIVLVGGGYIAFEFAHVAVRAGVQMMMLEQAPRVLKPFDAELVMWLVQKSRELGIDIRTGTAVEAVERQDGGFTVRTASNGKKENFAADLVVHAAGRTPALESLDLDAAGIAHERGRLKLNEFLQSLSNPAVYAAGDAAEMGPPLTPVASHDGKIAAANLLEGNRHRPNYLGVPSVVFTIPPLASVGLREEEAKAKGLRFRVNHQKTSEWYTSRRVNENAAGFKVLVEEGSGRILGAHLLGVYAEELINLFALAIRSGMSASELRDTIFAYPTAASDVSYML